MTYPRSRCARERYLDVNAAAETLIGVRDDVRGERPVGEDELGTIQRKARTEPASGRDCA